MRACSTCTPTHGEFDRHFAREALVSTSGYGLSLCTCPSCRQVLARFWVELVTWCDGDDKIRRYWVPVTSTQAEALRGDPMVIQNLLLITPHWVQEPDSDLVRRVAPGFGRKIRPQAPIVVDDGRRGLPSPAEQ
jgi:hypothetical protein